MKHLYVSEYGSFLGLDNALCIVKEKEGTVVSLPLSRLNSIHISKSVAISSDLILECARRGIQIHFLDWTGRSVAAINGLHSNAVVQVRKNQLKFIESPALCCDFTSIVLSAKVINQRAVLLYFGKYHKNPSLLNAAEKLMSSASRIKEFEGTFKSHETNWRDGLFGLEGGASMIYWQALRDSSLVPESFQVRDGRGSTEITNQALNYGYAVLQSHVWNAITNAGLEPYAGILHTDRPGKPSLVLDAMEIYRAWVVDRCVIKMRTDLSKELTFGASQKKRLLSEIASTLSTRLPSHGKRLKLETILQRQAYLMAGHFASKSRYKAHHFRW